MYGHEHLPEKSWKFIGKNVYEPWKQHTMLYYTVLSKRDLSFQIPHLTEFLRQLP